jgi:hypothetical protein
MDENHLALAINEWPMLEQSGGMGRVGEVHGNTLGEVDRLRAAPIKIVESSWFSVGWGMMALSGSTDT